LKEKTARIDANAISGVRQNATQIADKVTEVLAYRTAVHVEIFRGKK